MPSTFVLYFSETKFSFMKTNQKTYLKKNTHKNMKAWHQYPKYCKMCFRGTNHGILTTIE